MTTICWIFDPATDYMIRMLPEGLFLICDQDRLDVPAGRRDPASAQSCGETKAGRRKNKRGRIRKLVLLMNSFNSINYPYAGKCDKIKQMDSKGDRI